LLVILVQSLQGLVDGPHDIPETTVRRRLAAVQAALDDISGAITLKE
jgi:predicted ABC-type ATPase